jgi:hypothetical protein
MAGERTEGLFDDALVEFIQIDRFFSVLVKMEPTRSNHFEAHAAR